MLQPVSRIVDLLDPALNRISNMSVGEARRRVLEGDPAGVRAIDGSFAIVAAEGVTVRLARSLDRPMRYFLAKRHEGPALYVADRIDTLHAALERDGLANQFHPSYTRMIPAHYVVEIALVGCPDPDPIYTRFFTPQTNALPATLDEIGRRYVGAMANEIEKWLRHIETSRHTDASSSAPESIGVAFSGGIDSGAVFLVTYHTMIRLGLSPTRLKAFVLNFGAGPDLDQARAFLSAVGLSLFLEEIDAPAERLDIDETLRVLEDYKPLDVECAAMGLELCRGIRARYPDWRHLADGDGGDENLKDYPIEENHELTIRSVIDNLMLYQEGWGVGRIKHSLTYSGGLSRSYVRTVRACAQIWLRRLQSVCAAGSDRGGRGDSVCGVDRLRRAEPLRAQGRDREHEASRPSRDSTCRSFRSAVSSTARSRPTPCVRGSGEPSRRIAGRSTASTRNAVMSLYPAEAAARDRFILERRPPRAVHDPWRAHGVTVEEERSADGSVARVATVFLTGRECPWRCVMCDLWQHTTESDTPRGAIAAQVAAAQSALDQSGDPVSQIKLYNAGSFFDPRAVPEDDYDDVAGAVAGLARVIVESHPSLVGARTSRFLDALHRRQLPGSATPALEVAMGLETAHPDALERLHKRMTVDGFAVAAERLRSLGVALRVFLLVSPPFVPAREQDDWLLRSVDVALAAGASVISLVPTRHGNGALEALADEGLFRAPRLADLERSLTLAQARAIAAGTRVFADLWDLQRFSDCPHCLDVRRNRLHTMNLEQRDLPAAPCRTCDSSPH